jgi:thiamine pyrophosphokinase
VWCGDGDSLGKHAKEILGHTAARFEGCWREHFYPTNKDFSDCAAVVAIFEHDVRHSGGPSGSCWLRVHGAIGGRYDHELANLFEFSAMLARLSNPAVVQLGPNRTVTTAALRLNIESGRQFSLVPAFANQSCAVRIGGAHYSGEVFLQQPSHGISNTALSGHVVIEPVSTSVPIIVILPQGNFADGKHSKSN